MEELKKVFSESKALKLTLIISVIYVLPLVVADYDYLDDYRRNMYGYGWQHDGRFIATFQAKLWSLNSSNFSIFPFSTILSAAVLGFTGYLLTYLFNIEKDKTLKWSSLLIVTMPTFLGNLVFKFDCLPMALSLLVVVLPYLFYKSWIKFFAASVVGIFLSLGLYQSGATVYFIVGSLFLIRELLNTNHKLFFNRFCSYIISFVCAFLIYVAVVKVGELPVSGRTEVIIGNENFIELLKANHDIFLQRLDLVLGSGNYKYLLIFFCTSSLIGLLFYMYQNKDKFYKTLAIVPLILIILVVNTYLISSVNIVLKETYWDLRTFCGLGFLLMNFAYFQNYLKGYFAAVGRFAIFLTVAFSFILMAQFGRILTNQNQFQHAISASLAPHFNDGSITKIGFIGTLNIAPKNEFAYSKFPLFKNILSNPIGQYSAWTFDALNTNGMLKSTEIISGEDYTCVGTIIEVTKFYHVRKINHETLVIDFNRYSCD